MMTKPKEKRWAFIVSAACLLFSLGLSFSSLNFSSDSKVTAASSFDAGYGSSSNIDTSWASKNLAYFSLASNSLPYNSDWSIRYLPKTTDAITLTRDGVSHNVANTGGGMIIKYGDTDYCLNTDDWLYSSTGLLPFKAGDVFTIDGAFTGTVSGETYDFSIQKTSIIFSSRGTSYYDVVLPTHSKEVSGVTVDKENTWWFFFKIPSLTETEAPVTGDSDSIAYFPTQPSCLLLDGEPVADLSKQAFRRRDSGDSYYLSVQDDFQKITSKADVGSVLLLDHEFVCTAGVDGYAKNETAGLSFHEEAFLRIGDGVSNWSKIDNFRTYLSSLLSASYDPDDYDAANQSAIEATISTYSGKIAAAADAAAAYALYKEGVSKIGEYSISQEALAKLATYREKCVAELQGYVSLDDYFDDQKSQVSTYISEGVTAINAALSKTAITDALTKAKANIDGVLRKGEVGEQAVSSKSEGYQGYLETYNVLSLYDLNLGERKTFASANDALDTDTRSDTVLNNFAPLADNETNSLVFQFVYEPTSLSNSLITIRLRGFRYFAYRFSIGSDSGGLFVNRGESDASDTFLGGTSGTFVAGGSYKVKLGAIDIKDSDRTWLYAEVDGTIVFEKIIDSISFCDNNRVSLQTSSGVRGSLGQYSEGTSVTPTINGGRFRFKSGHSDNQSNLYLSLRENSAPSSDERDPNYYPSLESCLIFTHGATSTAIGDTSTASLCKYSSTEYLIPLAKYNLSIADGDSLTVEGTFSSFTVLNDQKTLLSVHKSVFVYDADSATWKQTLTLADAKSDASEELNAYVVLANYDAADQADVSSALSSGLSAIDSSTSLDQVDEALSSAKAAIDAILTSLGKHQAAAIADLNAYKADALNDYRAEEQASIASIKETAAKDIKKAETAAAVDQLLSQAKEDIDALETDAVLAKQELAAAKLEAKQTLRDYYGSLDLGSYSEEELATLNKAVMAALDDIDAAASISEVDNIVASFKMSYPLAAATPAETSFPTWGIVLIAGGSIVLVAGAGLVVWLLFKKKRKTAK